MGQTRRSNVAHSINKNSPNAYISMAEPKKKTDQGRSPSDPKEGMAFSAPAMELEICVAKSS